MVKNLVPTETLKKLFPSPAQQLEEDKKKREELPMEIATPEKMAAAENFRNNQLPLDIAAMQAKQQTPIAVNKFGVPSTERPSTPEELANFNAAVTRQIANAGNTQAAFQQISQQGINSPNISPEVQARNEAQFQREKAQERLANFLQKTQNQPLPSPSVKIGNNPIDTAVTGAGVAGGLAAGAGALVGASSVASGIGAIAVIGGAIAKMTTSKRQEIKEAKTLYTQSRRNIKGIIASINAGADPDMALQAYQQQIADILYSRRILKEETSTNLKKFMSGGADELIQVEKFLETKPYYDNQMLLALATPDPNKVFTDPLEEVSTNENQ